MRCRVAIFYNIITILFFTRFVKPVEDSGYIKNVEHSRRPTIHLPGLKNPFLAGTLQALISFIKRLP